LTQETIIHLAQEALSVTLLVSAPILGLGMLVGIIVSILQATTQIQEQTLTFVPKIVAVMASILIFGHWMLNLITTFTQMLFTQLPNYIY